MTGDRERAEELLWEGSFCEVCGSAMNFSHTYNAFSCSDPNLGFPQPPVLLAAYEKSNDPRFSQDARIHGEQNGGA